MAEVRAEVPSHDGPAAWSDGERDAVAIYLHSIDAIDRAHARLTKTARELKKFTGPDKKSQGEGVEDAVWRSAVTADDLASKEYRDALAESKRLEGELGHLKDAMTVLDVGRKAGRQKLMGQLVGLAERPESPVLTVIEGGKDREVAEAALERVEEDVERLVEDLHAVGPVLKSSSSALGLLRRAFSQVEKAFRGLFRKAEATPVAPSAEELRRANDLLVKFDSDRPPIDVLANGLRTLLARLGNPIMVSKEFDDPDSAVSKYHAEPLMESIRQILEAKKTADPLRAPLYDQGARLTHAIQSEARLAHRSDAAEHSNVFLRAEDFSDEKQRQDERKIGKMRRESAEARSRQDASIRQVSDELAYALIQIGVDLSGRDEKFLDGVKGRALSFEQFLMANDTFNNFEPEQSLLSRVRKARDSPLTAQRQWAIYADILIGMLKDLTARGSTIESVVLPSRPRQQQRRAATGTHGADGIAAK